MFLREDFESFGNAVHVQRQIFLHTTVRGWKNLRERVFDDPFLPGKHTLFAADFNNFCRIQNLAKGATGNNKCLMRTGQWIMCAIAQVICEKEHYLLWRHLLWGMLIFHILCTSPCGPRALDHILITFWVPFIGILPQKTHREAKKTSGRLKMHHLGPS